MKSEVVAWQARIEPYAGRKCLRATARRDLMSPAPGRLKTGQRVRFVPVGPEDHNVGPPTQMGVFERE